MAEGGTLDAEPSLDTNGSNKRNAEEAGLEEATGGNGYDRQANMRRRQELMQQQRDKQEQQRKLEIEIRLQQAEEKRLKLKQLKKAQKKAAEEKRKADLEAKKKKKIEEEVALQLQLAPLNATDGDQRVTGPRPHQGKADQKMEKEVKKEVERRMKEREKLMKEKCKLEQDQARAEQQWMEKQRAHLGLSKPLKYPADDLALDLHRPLWVRSKLRLHKIPSYLMTDILMVFDFLRTFSKTLGLSPFNLESFMDSLGYDQEDTVLSAEIHMALLRLLLSDRHLDSYYCRSDIKGPSGPSSSTLAVIPSAAGALIAGRPNAHAVTSLTWPALLREVAPYLEVFQQIMSDEFDPEDNDLLGGNWGLDDDGQPVITYRSALEEAIRALDVQEHYALPFRSKVAVLRLLVDAAYETEKVSDFVAGNCETRHQVVQRKRAEENEIKRQQREELAAKREEVIKKLKKKMEDDYKASQKKAKAAEDKTAASLTTEVGEGKKPSNKEGNKGKGKKKQSKASGTSVDDAGMAPTTSAEDGAQAPVNGDGAISSTESAAIPRFNPSNAQVAAALEALLEAEATGGELEVTELAEELPLSEDEDDLMLDADEEALESLSRMEKIQRRKEIEKRLQRKRWKEKERERRERQRQECERALEMLNNSLKDGTNENSLRAALKAAKQAGLEGVRENDQKRWCTPEVKAVYKALYDFEQRKKRSEIEERYARELTTCTIRTEPLGYDRDLRSYYIFGGDDRIFIHELHHVETGELLGVFLANEMKREKERLEQQLQERLRREREEYEAFSRLKKQIMEEESLAEEAASAVAMSRLPLPEQDVYSGRDHLCMNGSEETKANFRRYAPGQFRSVWYCMPSFEDNVRALASRLDTRAIREKALVDKLYDYFVLRPAEHGDSGQDDNIWRTSGNEWIGRRVLRVYDIAEAGAENTSKSAEKQQATAAVGTIVGWIPAEENDGVALWHVEHEDGDEEDLEDFEVLDGIQKLAEAEANGTIQEGWLGKPQKIGTAFRRYLNALWKDGPRSEEDLGLPALKRELLRREATVVPALKEKRSDWDNKPWTRKVIEATDIVEVRSALLELEEALHAIQEGDDKEEEEEEEEGEEEDRRGLVGQRLRIFDEESVRDGLVVRFDGKQEEDGKELYLILLDDGAQELLRPKAVKKGMRALQENKQAASESDNEDDSDSDEESEQEEEPEVPDDDDAASSNTGYKKSGEEEEEVSIASSVDGARKTLWKSSKDRRRWLAAVEGASTVATLALALLCLFDTASDYGLVTENANQDTTPKHLIGKMWRQSKANGKSPLKVQPRSYPVRVTRSSSEFW